MEYIFIRKNILELESVNMATNKVLKIDYVKKNSIVPKPNTENKENEGAYELKYFSINFNQGGNRKASKWEVARRATRRGSMFDTNNVRQSLQGDV